MKHIKRFNEKIAENSTNNDNDLINKLFDEYEKDLGYKLDDTSSEEIVIIKRALLIGYNYNNSISDETIISRIEDIIHSEIYLRDVPYSRNYGTQESDKEVDPDSAKDAAKSIIDMLREDGFIK